jgi:hypothetical protein
LANLATPALPEHEEFVGNWEVDEDVEEEG